MKKQILRKMLTIMCVCFIIGLVIIFTAPLVGRAIGDAVMRHYGVMDMSHYEQIVATNTTSFQLAGLVISLVSGLGLVVGGYARYQEM